jgi:hypothetical protein
MKRFPILTCGVLLIALASLTARSHAQLVPPNSNAFGKSFEEWNVLHAQRAIAEVFGGGSDVPETVRRVRLFPGNFHTGPFEFDITLRPGTPFVSAPLLIFGETYDDPRVADDDPEDPFIVDLIDNIEVVTVLDGQVLMDGAVAELEQFKFGPVFFEEPIAFDPPQPRGTDRLPGGEELFAIGAVWVQGVGAVFRPLPPGEHTLVQSFEHELLGRFEFTYNITVRRK